MWIEKGLSDGRIGAVACVRSAARSPTRKEHGDVGGVGVAVLGEVGGGGHGEVDGKVDGKVDGEEENMLAVCEMSWD